MFTKKLVILLSLTFVTKLSATEYARNNQLPGISEPLKSKIMSVTTRQSGGTQRPEACPLESKLHLNLLAKVTNIKSLFIDNCLDNDQSIVTDILEGAETIQAEIDAASKKEEESEQAVPEETPTSSSIDIGGIEIDGKTVADVISNINNIYTKKSCSKLSEHKGFLGETADIILDIAKIGLLVPNTTVLSVAGGGVALSSTLNILNNIFTKRFDFEETEDRQTFIKLNCAFYDIRRDIEKSGFLDVSTDDHEKDQIIVKDLLKTIDKEFKQFNLVLEKINKNFSEAKKEFYEEQSGHLYEVITDLEKITESVNQPIQLPSQKLAFIELITRNSVSLQQRLKRYSRSNSDELNFLNLQLMSILKKFDYTNLEGIVELQSMELGEFVLTIQEILKYHFDRLEKTYDKMLDKIDKKWAKKPYGEFETPSKFSEALKNEYSKKGDEYEMLYLGLKNVDARLKRIIDEVAFTSADDGTENVVSILSEFDSIVDQIYGKHGQKFLKYTAKKSIKTNKDFNKNFLKFAESHLKKTENGFKLKNINEITPLRLMYACQDARPFRRQWKLAESLAQQGYDFVATNADLFHSDINRIFWGRSGGRKYGIHRILSKYEKIQMHHKSAIYAKKHISGIPFDKKYHRKYLRKKFLGRSILEVTESKKKARILQELIEVYDCPKQTIML